MSHHHKRNRSLAEVVGEFEFEAADKFRSGHGSVKDNPGRVRFFGGSNDYPSIVQQMAQQLYDRHYTQSDEGRGSYAVLNDRLLKDEFAGLLSAANTTRVSTQPGWKVLGKENERLLIGNERGDKMSVTLEEFDGPHDGTEGKLLMRRDSATLQPGWFHVRGEQDHSMGGEGERTTRVYWNISRQGAAPLVNSVTLFFNKARVPFHFKICDDPQTFMRADCAVLYFDRALWRSAIGPLLEVHAHIRQYLKGPTPLFTKRVARGVGVADDPATGESFGMNRCRLVAEGLWDAFVAGANQRKHEFVSRRFAKAGLDVDRAWLSPGEEDVYLISLQDPGVPVLVSS